MEFVTSPSAIPAVGNTQSPNTKSLRIHEALPNAATLSMMSNSVWREMYLREWNSVINRLPLPECRASLDATPPRQRWRNISKESQEQQEAFDQSKVRKASVHVVPGDSRCIAPQHPRHSEQLINVDGSPLAAQRNIESKKTSLLLLDKARECGSDDRANRIVYSPVVKSNNSRTSTSQPSLFPSTVVSVDFVKREKAALLLNAGTAELLGRLPVSYPRHAHIRSYTRRSVVAWMGRAVRNFEWPQSVFFIGVEAVDRYLWCAARPSDDRCPVPLLATAGLLLGLSLAADTDQANQANAFVGRVPHVTCATEVLHLMLKLATAVVRKHSDPLKLNLMSGSEEKCVHPNCGVSVNATPHDLLCLYLARLRESPDWKSLYYSLLATDTLKGVTETTMATAVYFYEVGAHTLVPCSRLLAVILLMLLSNTRAELGKPMVAASFSREILKLDFKEEVQPYVLYLYPLINQIASSEISEGNPLLRSLLRSNPNRITLINDCQDSEPSRENSKNFANVPSPEPKRSLILRTPLNQLSTLKSRRLPTGSTYAETLSPDISAGSDSDESEEMCARNLFFDRIDS
eukprot:Selendium_serpulae@DN4955_c0_g1_i1.p1